MKPLPPLDALRAAFSYNPKTGVLRRKSSRLGTPKLGAPLNLANVRWCAGGVWELYATSRIAWKLHHGVDPDHEIRRKNGDPFDNSIANLYDSASRTPPD